jgi:hypothetical protein
VEGRKWKAENKKREGDLRIDINIPLSTFHILIKEVVEDEKKEFRDMGGYFCRYWNPPFGFDDVEN